MGGVSRSTRGRLEEQRQCRVAYLTTRLGGGNGRLDELGRDYPWFHDPRFARVRGVCGYRIECRRKRGKAGSTEDFAAEGVTRLRFPLWVRPTTPKGGSP
jgi:hypothetical protein